MPLVPLLSRLDVDTGLNDDVATAFVLSNYRRAFLHISDGVCKRVSLETYRFVPRPHHRHVMSLNLATAIVDEFNCDAASPPSLLPILSSPPEMDSRSLNT